MIQFEGFTKRYRGRAAVEALTLLVPRGSVVALLGPNGSGKTTTIKAAAGLIHPDAGVVRVGPSRREATEARARESFAFLPQRVSFPEPLTGREIVEFYRRLRKAPAADGPRVLALASLNGAGSRAVGTYSGGMVQRLGLAVAAIGEPELLLLDEPTAALDPDGLRAFYDLVDATRQVGRTVFFSSHQLGDVERLADHVAVIVAGRLRASLSAQELAAALADRGLMRVHLDRPAPGLLDAVRELAPRSAWRHDELMVPGPATVRPAVLERLRAAGATVTSISTEEGRLDTFYRELIGGTP